MKSKKCFRVIFWLSCSLLLILAGCSSDEDNPFVPKILIDALRTAPERIVLGDQEYGLETMLWRDFMPICPPDGRPMVAFIQVVEQNGNPIASDLKLEYLWLIYDSKFWATALSDESLPLPPENELHGIARDGPKWGPGVQVDAVVGLRRGEGSLELLRASDQWISRTD